MWVAFIQLFFSISVDVCLCSASLVIFSFCSDPSTISGGNLKPHQTYRTQTQWMWWKWNRNTRKWFVVRFKFSSARYPGGWKCTADGIRGNTDVVDNSTGKLYTLKCTHICIFLSSFIRRANNVDKSSREKKLCTKTSQSVSVFRVLYTYSI